MRAMLLERPRAALTLADIAIPRPAAGQLLIQVEACGVCRTDLHIADGELPILKTPLVLGHQIVGRVVSGRGEVAFEEGARVGVPWVGWTCGTCSQCIADRENLCD